MRVNSPPKSGPSPCGGITTFAILFFAYLSVKLEPYPIGIIYRSKSLSDLSSLDSDSLANHELIVMLFDIHPRLMC
jgi:hypothetical protein